MFVPFDTPSGSDTYFINVNNIISIHASRAQPELCYIKMVDGTAYSIGMAAAGAVAKIAAFKAD